LLDQSFGSLEPAQRDILHRITKNASNLSHLINDLVDLSRIEADRMRIEMEVVAIEPLFAELTAVMEVLLAGHDVVFRAAIDPGVVHVHADPDRLKQIVSNLLVNAVKFTERGSIMLNADTTSDGRVVMSVTDTGIGISSADHQAIFEPFRQVHDREHRAPGAGIGLAISLRLAKLMGGSLSVESAPGQGSRFTLVLQVQDPSVSQPAEVVGLRKVS
jgi:signal transduction histidine kinase